MTLVAGLCWGSDFDNQYSWTGTMINDRHSFSGYTDTILFFDAGMGKWKLQLYSDPDKFAVMEGGSEEYPFGDQHWFFTDDSCQKGSHDSVLSMSACVVSEFQCKDGQCIPMMNRCDGKINCQDKSGKN